MSDEELFTVFPIFLLIDVSASMSGGPIEAVNQALPDLKREMLANPIVGEIARVGIVTFSDEGRVALPLCDLAYADLPEIMVEGGTNFASGLRTMKDAIRDGLGALPRGTPLYKPVVFLMSDGQHMARESWKASLDELTNQRPSVLNPEIVCFGFGDAEMDDLRAIATRFAFLSRDTDPVSQVREVMHALLSSIRTSSQSFSDPSKADGLHLDVPAEKFVQLEKFTL